jgi:TrpR family transcriptional regulator, trp operon repressor
MPNDTELVSSNIAEMSKALANADSQLIEDFLYCLFTPSEADEIAKRWALVKQIASGRPQREIAKDLGLSLCKITRGSRELKKEDSAWKRVLALAGVDVPDSIARRRAGPGPQGGVKQGATAAMPS